MDYELRDCEHSGSGRAYCKAYMARSIPVRSREQHDLSRKDLSEIGLRFAKD
jgi:hypothetical protein